MLLYRDGERKNKVWIKITKKIKLLIVISSRWVTILFAYKLPLGYFFLFRWKTAFLCVFHMQLYQRVCFFTPSIDFNWNLSFEVCFFVLVFVIVETTLCFYLVMFLRLQKAFVCSSNRSLCVKQLLHVPIALYGKEYYKIFSHQSAHNFLIKFSTPFWDDLTVLLPVFP